MTVQTAMEEILELEKEHPLWDKVATQRTEMN